MRRPLPKALHELCKGRKRLAQLASRIAAGEFGHEVFRAEMPFELEWWDVPVVTPYDLCVYLWPKAWEFYHTPHTQPKRRPSLKCVRNIWVWGPQKRRTKLPLVSRAHDDTAVSVRMWFCLTQTQYRMLFWAKPKYLLDHYGSWVRDADGRKVREDWTPAQMAAHLRCFLRRWPMQKGGGPCA
jgi:hypothetical protein